MINLMTVSPN